MGQENNVYSDREYKLLSEISDNENITQRELSKKLNLSLGSVNILIKKMIKEGLIKMNQVSTRQVFYMLTPAGLVEKANKTSRYIKIHYNAINQTKEKIKRVLEKLDSDYDNLYILIDENEMNQVLKASVDEYINTNGSKGIEVIKSIKKVSDKKSSVLIYLSEDYVVSDKYKYYKNLNTLNLLEVI